MRPTIAALALCVVLVVAGAGAASGSPLAGGEAATAPPSSAAGDAAALDALQEDEETEQSALNVSSAHEIAVQVDADGDARFAVTWTFPAETDAQRDAFSRLAEQFENGEFDVASGTFETLVDDVEAASGRSMALQNVDRDATVADGTGDLTLAFTWTNFAETATEEEIVVEDAFETDDGVWLRSLGPEQRLILRAPEGYGVGHSNSLVQDNAVVWEGPETFESGDFRTVFDGSPSLFDSWLALGGVGLLLVGAGAAGLWWLRGRDATADAEQTPGDESGPRPTGDGGATVDEPAADSSAGAGAAAGAAGAAAGDDAGDADDESGAEDDGIDPELLSDEERVERLLERNGGRMKQARIVDETGWSNAKVSQLLSQMSEDDRVDKLRLGRENLITLPDEDVTATE